MANKGSRSIALLFLDHGPRRAEGLASRPARSLPPGNPRYPLYRRLGEPQCRSGQMRKISPPPGFDPRAVQPVASRYTDYATQPTQIMLYADNPYVIFGIRVNYSEFGIPCLGYLSYFICPDSSMETVKVRPSV